MSLGSNFPRPPSSGDPITAVWARLVCAALWAVRPIAGKGIRISPGPRGCIIEAVAQSGSGGGKAAEPDPFEPINVPTGDPDMKAVTVTFGIVNNIVPTIDDTPLDAADPSTLLITGSGSIYLDTVWSGEEPKTLESAEVKFTEDDVPEDDDEHGYQLLSTITMSDDGKRMTINKGVTHSLRVERMHCGTGDGATTYYGWAGV